MMAAARLEARLSAAAAPNGSENSISSAAASNEEAAHSSASAATSTPATLRWDASRVPSNVVLSADGSTATHSNPILDEKEQGLEHPGSDFGLSGDEKFVHGVEANHECHC